MNKQTAYRTFVDDQLLEAKSNNDNFSQADAFFCAINKQVLFNEFRPSMGYKKKEQLSKMKQEKYRGSPLASRNSIFKQYARLPTPELSKEMMHQQFVNQQHDSSSEDDLIMDKKFRETSKNITKDMILKNLHDWQLEAVEENIKAYNYSQVKKKGKIT